MGALVSCAASWVVGPSIGAARPQAIIVPARSPAANRGELNAAVADQKPSYPRRSWSVLPCVRRPL